MLDASYEFVRMPFGMNNCGIRKILTAMNDVESYIDDLIVHTKDRKTHLEVLDELFGRLREANLTARPSKCVIATKSVEFLSHQIG